MRLEPRARRYEASWHSLQSELDLESARLQLLLNLTNSMVAHLELNDLLRGVTIGARRLMQSDFAILALLDSQSGRLRANASEFADDTMLDAEAVNSFAEILAAHVVSTRKPWTGVSADLVGGIGDFVIHFNHSTWRDDRNDPATATRVSGRKMH
jgi:hypothetical protein